MSPPRTTSEGGGENTVPVDMDEGADEARAENHRRSDAALPATVTAAAAAPPLTAMTANLCPSPSLPQQPPRHRVAIFWFRRDLRVSDNPALMAAAAEADYVVRVGKREERDGN